MRAAHQGSVSGIGLRRRDPNGHVRLSVSERRQFKRDAIAMRATLRINQESYSAELLDISVGGAQLRCSLVPRTGLLISIETEGLGVIPARVVRRLPRTIAVEFDIPETRRTEFKEKLDRLLKTPA